MGAQDGMQKELGYVEKEGFRRTNRLVKYTNHGSIWVSRCIKEATVCTETNKGGHRRRVELVLGI